jgi:FixJ family two-component response regulator
MRSPKTAALARVLPPEPARAGVPETARGRTIALVSQDPSLATTLRAATPERTVMVVATPFALADLLLQESTAVAVIDNALLGDSAAKLVDRLAEQFPELALITVGPQSDASLHARQLAEGRLFRFLQRPVSVERTRTFVEAALRRHEERRPVPRRVVPVRALVASAAVFAAIAGLAGLALRPASPATAAPTAASAAHAPGLVGPVRRAGPTATPRAPRKIHAASARPAAAGTTLPAPDRMADTPDAATPAPPAPPAAEDTRAAPAPSAD